MPRPPAVVCRRTALYIIGLPHGLSRASYLPPQPRNVCRGLCKELAWSIRSRKVERIEGGLHRSIVGPSSSPTQSRQLRRLQRLAFLQPELMTAPMKAKRSLSARRTVPAKPTASPRPLGIVAGYVPVSLPDGAGPPEIIDASRNRQLQRHPIPPGASPGIRQEAIGRSPNSRAERLKRNLRFI